MSVERGYRGYISSRPIRGTSFPQRIQNSVVRTYAQRNELAFKLSLTEYAMPGCFMMLQTLLDELAVLDGLILFSMFMLPPQRAKRAEIYRRVIGSGAQLHAALEESAIRNDGDLARFEDTLDVARALQAAPLGGRYLKDGAAFPAADPFAANLRRVLRPS